MHAYTVTHNHTLNIQSLIKHIHTIYKNDKKLKI